MKSSGGQTKARQGITKHGSPYLRAWAYLAAENARQYDPELKAYYQRLLTNGKHYLTAMCATSARLLERVYGILSEQAGQTEKESKAQSAGTGQNPKFGYPSADSPWVSVAKPRSSVNGVARQGVVYCSQK